MPGCSACTLAGILAAAAALAQVEPPQAFEVASVRPNTLDDRIVTLHIGPGNRFDVRGYTLVLLMQQAYGVMDWNITGGPVWIRKDRFDVSAKASADRDLSAKQLQPMLQRLLADRFSLKVHTTSKAMHGYALAVAGGGPKMTAALAGEEHPDTFRMGASGLSGQAIAMPTLARFVGGKLGLVAVDETGLKGLYDFKIDWKVETDASSGDDKQAALRFAATEALKDQLGLKLTPKRITVQMIAIDQVQKPSAN